MQNKDVNPELISALADGQLFGAEFDHTLEGLHRSDAARSTWHAYHVVGDVLRSGDAIQGSNDAVFMQRLRQRLQSEAPATLPFPTLDLVADEALALKGGAAHQGPQFSANAPWFRWRWVAGVMSLAAVSLIGWQFGFKGGAFPEAPQLVLGAPASTVTAGDTTVMIRDPQLDALLLAHRQFGGTSALQMPAGFVRNATFEGASR